VPIRLNADESVLYDKWVIDRAFVQVPMQALVATWFESFKTYPIRQKPASFNLDRVMEQLSSTPAGR
jgi:arylsulfatase